MGGKNRYAPTKVRIGPGMGGNGGEMGEKIGTSVRVGAQDAGQGSGPKGNSTVSNLHMECLCCWDHSIEAEC